MIFKTSRIIVVFILSFSLIFTYWTKVNATEITTLSFKNITATVRQYDKYTLPNTVTATMSNGSTQKFAVTWNTNKVDTSKIGVITYTGTVSGYSNKIKLTLNVQTYIKLITNISATVKQGDKYTLPSTITATMSDNSTQKIAVTWNTNKVDTSKVGVITYTGTVSGYSNKIKLTLDVQTYIKLITNISATVKQGDKYTLPSTITATMSDGSTQKIAVTWNTNKVDTSTAYTQYNFQGTVSGYTNKVKLVLTIEPNTPINNSPTRGRNVSGSDIVAYANNFKGTPYVWGGTSPQPGFDSPGFVQYVYAHFGINLPRTTYDQVKKGHAVSLSDLRPGDLVFFGPKSSPYHVGIYVGGGNYIHSSETDNVVKISSLSYSHSFSVARRVL